jgi:hypothetical protein
MILRGCGSVLLVDVSDWYVVNVYDHPELSSNFVWVVVEVSDGGVEVVSFVRIAFYKSAGLSHVGVVHVSYGSSFGSPEGHLFDTIRLVANKRPSTANGYLWARVVYKGVGELGGYLGSTAEVFSTTLNEFCLANVRHESGEV